MNATFKPKIEHDARFSWDNGRGETRCSAMYLERRNFQRIAVGRAAEARMLGKIELACSFEEQARRLSLELEELQKAGHIGPSNNFHKGEFKTVFDTMRLQDLKIL